MKKLKRIEVEGFKSIRKMDLELGDINVLIGANGAGKSNLLSLFKMLNSIVKGEMQLFIIRFGGADAFLNYGSNNNPEMNVALNFELEKGQLLYKMKLANAVPDTLIFETENGYYKLGTSESFLNNSNSKESALSQFSKPTEVIKIAKHIFKQFQVFQFNDTSETASIRKHIYIRDYNNLQSDARNLAAFLYMLQESKPDYYQRIISTIKLAAPFFKDFILKPDPINSNMIMLNWREIKSDYLFGPHQLPDGLLRFIALTTLLLQPEEYLPEIIIIDEPELGLHPYAIEILGGSLKSVSHHSQVIIATQSVNLVDQFEPEDIITVERKNGESVFNRPEMKNLEEWLEDYTLSELWEKNVLGGTPSR
ncbi:MAG: AAA family ATPase [Candidatus Hatepunaea meridiana]|nr:AAA family ATPase [Candidatus Hatepunaea meridiana]